MSDFAVCTIASKNYLPRARVLAASVRKHSPGTRFFLLLVDRVDDCFDPASEPFEMLTLEELGLPHLEQLCFKYDIVELNTAVKPFLIEHLMDRRGCQRVAFLDPDMEVFHDVNRIAAQLDEHAIAITPFLIGPSQPEHWVPDETCFLQYGAYNCGFIAAKNCAEGRRFLSWWGRRLYSGCRAAIERGLFVDQKWIDLVPAYFSGVHIIKDPGCNVAFWNLHERPITFRGDKPFIGEVPVCFFHFSSFRVDEPAITHHPEFSIVTQDIGEARRLFDDYRTRLLANGEREARTWPYAFARFDNGVAISREARRRYLDLGDQVAGFGDPFRAGAPGSFYRWLKSFELLRVPAGRQRGDFGPDFSRPGLASPRLSARVGQKLRRARDRVRAGWQLWAGASR